jgi:hypothetical protein
VAIPTAARTELTAGAAALADLLQEEGADSVRGLFTPLSLEFEKTYFPYLLVAKKMYAGGKYEQPEKMKKVETKGLQLARRTAAEVARVGQVQALDCLMKERSREKALDITLKMAALILGGSSGDVPEDLKPYEFSQKLSYSYKTTAVGFAKGGKEVKVKVEVTFDGRWHPTEESGWAQLRTQPPEGRDRTLPCTRAAYRPWDLLDNAGARVGRVALVQPHLHAALSLEERSPGKGPRPGDRVRYVVLGTAHEKAAGAVLATQAAYAYSTEEAVKAMTQGARPHTTKYYDLFISGVSSFMEVVAPGIKAELQRRAKDAAQRDAAVARRDAARGALEERRETLQMSGHRSERTYFAGTGTWATASAQVDSPIKRQKVSV